LYKGFDIQVKQFLRVGFCVIDARRSLFDPSAYLYAREISNQEIIDDCRMQLVLMRQILLELASRLRDNRQNVVLKICPSFPFPFYFIVGNASCTSSSRIRETTMEDLSPVHVEDEGNAEAIAAAISEQQSCLLVAFNPMIGDHHIDEY
jgi:hypothetical protein